MIPGTRRMSKEEVMAIYEREYKATCEFCESIETKFEWAASYVFGLVTYDSGLDEMFVRKILEVCMVIISGGTYEYISINDERYVEFVLVCQLLDKKNWISQGSSIREVFFDDGYLHGEPILAYCDEQVYRAVKFSVDNLQALIEFVLDEEVEEDDDNE